MTSSLEMAREDGGDVRHAAGAARGDDGDAQAVGECRVNVAGIAVPGAVMVHGREQDFAGAAFLGLLRPGEELLVGGATSTVRSRVPEAVRARFRVDRHDDELPAVLGRNLADEFRSGDGGAVQGDLVGPGVQQARRVVQAPDAATHGKGDVDGFSNMAAFSFSGSRSMAR